MNVSLSLWLALLVSSCCGNAGSEEEEPTTDYYDYATATATADYDYNATFDYEFITGLYEPDRRNKAKSIAPMSPVLLLGLAVHQIWT